MTKQKKATTIIIGGGLTGLACAALLEKSDHDYILLEAQGEYGGLAKGQLEQGVWLDHGLKSIPAGENIGANPLLVLKKILNLDIQIESWTDAPQTLGKSGLTGFVGFGESQERALIEELGYYLESPRILVSGGWRNLTHALLSLIPESKRRLRSTVTRLVATDGIISSALVNGEVSIDADQVVITASPDLLKGMFAGNPILPKQAQRLGKTNPWTALSLDIATKTKITDAKNIFIFKDSGEQEFYVIGQFVSNADPSRNVADLQISSWLSLIDSEKALDEEYVSKAIKMMKKNIKKAFPLIVEGENSWERLLASPNAIAQYEHLGIEKSGLFQGFKNLYLIGSQMPGSSRNLANALSSAIEFSANFDKKLKLGNFSEEPVSAEQESTSPL